LSARFRAFWLGTDGPLRMHLIEQTVEDRDVRLIDLLLRLVSNLGSLHDVLWHGLNFDPKDLVLFPQKKTEFVGNPRHIEFFMRKPVPNPAPSAIHFGFLTFPTYKLARPRRATYPLKNRIFFPALQAKWPSDYTSWWFKMDLGPVGLGDIQGRLPTWNFIPLNSRL
jgi:hypothetical protein